MRAYLIRRLLLIIPALFMLTILVFLATRFIPGDAVDYIASLLGPQAGGPLDEEALRHRLGLGRACLRTVWTVDGRHIPARHLW